MTGVLDGKIALVTGGSRGIGAAIAVALAQAGAAVAVNYRERVDAADALVADLGKAGHRAIAIAALVSGPVQHRVTVLGGRDMTSSTIALGAKPACKRIFGSGRS